MRARRTDIPATPAGPATAPAGLALVAAAACLWGTAGIASKALYGLSEIGPLTVAFLRLAIAAPLLMALSLALVGRATFAFRGREAPLILLLGGAMALFQLCYFSAIALAGVAVATLVAICVAPLFVVLLARALLGERLTRAVAAALVLGLTGTALLVGVPSPDAGAGGPAPAGVAFAAGAALSYAVFTLCSRALAPKHHPFTLIAVGFGAGAMMLLPVAAGGLSIPVPTPGWALIAYIGLIPTALAYVFYFRGMKRVSATTASLVTLLEPLSATVLAWAVFDERLGPLGIAGALLLLGTIALLARAKS